MNEEQKTYMITLLLTIISILFLESASITGVFMWLAVGTFALSLYTLIDSLIGRMSEDKLSNFIIISLILFFVITIVIIMGCLIIGI